MDYLNPNKYWMKGMPDLYEGMNDDERLKAGCLQLAGLFGSILIGLLLCALLGSCGTTKYVPVTYHKTDTLRQVVSHRDSIYMRDSIYVGTRGDTVTIDRWHTKYRDRWRTDSIYISKTDTVPLPYPVEVTKEVAAPLTWWQQTRMHAGGVAIFLLIIFAVVKIFWRK